MPLISATQRQIWAQRVADEGTPVFVLVGSVLCTLPFPMLSGAVNAASGLLYGTVLGTLIFTASASLGTRLVPRRTALRGRARLMRRTRPLRRRVVRAAHCTEHAARARAARSGALEDAVQVRRRCAALTPPNPFCGLTPGRAPATPPPRRSLDSAIEDDAFMIVFLLRLSPVVPFAVASVLLALTPVPVSASGARVTRSSAPELSGLPLL